jgi:hypothetical protein
MPGLSSVGDRKIFVGTVLDEARRLGRSDAGNKKASWPRIMNLTNESACREFDRAVCPFVQPVEFAILNGVFAERTLVFKNGAQNFGSD